MASLVGKRLGAYELQEEIGRGAMGIVYRGRQVTLDRVVAVKVLLEELASDVSFVERFTREARISASLSHPNIIHIYDAGQSENLLYFAMEYISGPTVAQLLRQQGRLPVGYAVEIAAQVASALDYAHVEAHLVHRDVKPENMMVDRWGKVKVLDFGLARVAGNHAITRVGAVVGSLYYVPPEHLFGEKPDGRSDVYSLGVALYEMVTGQRPFRGQSLGELSHAILAGALTPPSALEPSVPADLEAIMLKALDRDREQRFRTAGELEAELRRWLAAHPPQAHKPAPPKAAVRTDTLAHPTPRVPKVRPSPSAPILTLPSIPQVPPQATEPAVTLSPTERPVRPAPKLTSNLPVLPEEGQAGLHGGAENAEGEEPSAGELLKDAASHLYQRFVSRLKKEERSGQ